jgi:microcin C transport system substrate-binding protein
MKRQSPFDAMLNRRTLIAGGSAALMAAPLQLRRAQAQTAATEAEIESHGLSSFGDLKYPPDFKHFDYVNPAAPKGGTFSHQISQAAGNQNFDTFNTLNMFVLKGDGAAGMDLIYDTLMARAADEPDAIYGLVARSVVTSADRRLLRFRLRPEARFHDGSPLTAEDVAFSIKILKEKGHPRFSQIIRNVEAAEVDGKDVVVRLAKTSSRDLPLIVAGLPIFSAHYYSTRAFDEATLEPPLGSSGYKVSRFEQGRFIEFERVKDYWGADLPVNRGQGNFDRMRFEYFRDRRIALEAFKAGAFLFREEFTSREWATGYDFPALREGRVKRDEIPYETLSGTQGWWFNMRREAFADRRIREAIGLAFDFEWTNANIMFGLLGRVRSFFQGSPMEAKGPPAADELALLEPWRGKVPDEVFGEPYMPPVSDGSGQDRNLLRRADEMLRAAGCKREGSVLMLPSGKPFEIEFLDFQSSLQPHTQPFIANLKRLGIAARATVVDAAQYQRRTDEYDYDVVSRRTSGSQTPDEGLRLMFASESARINGSMNIAGIADPAVDAMIDVALAAKTREALHTACRCLDRLLRAGRYWVPMWHKPTHWLAYWDMYSRPAVKPKYDRGLSTWWYDEEKARRIGKAG